MANLVSEGAQREAKFTIVSEQSGGKSGYWFYRPRDFRKEMKNQVSGQVRLKEFGRGDISQSQDGHGLTFHEVGL